MLLGNIVKNIKEISKETFLFKLYLRYIYKIKPYQSVVIELTNKCNLKCSYCPKSKGIGIGHDTLTIKQFKEIFKKINNDLNLKEILLTGFGEPLLCEDIEKIINYIKYKNKKIYTYLTTNGILYTPKRALNLSKGGLDQITVSLNFTNKENYLKYNKADFFDIVFTNLKEISSIKKEIKTRIIVQLLDLPENKKQIADFKSMVIKQWGFDFQLQPFVNWGGQIEYEKFQKDNYPKTQTERYPCAHIEKNIIVQTNGDIKVCCIAMPINAEHLTIGNIFSSDTLKEIIKGDKLKRLKKINMQTCLSNLPVCSSCDAWKNVPNFYIKIGNRWY